ncbi:hypothetical protein Scep_006215 [Stephania cephalantha]|uniref:Uncharacterized protein n=1 Tax=Stephania cephalantha TaxID=152367 RepID=A0AAP0PJW0_9MAGN
MENATTCRKDDRDAAGSRFARADELHTSHDQQLQEILRLLRAHMLCSLLRGLGGAQLVAEEPSLSRRSPALQSKTGYGLGRVWPWAEAELAERAGRQRRTMASSAERWSSRRREQWRISPQRDRTTARGGGSTGAPAARTTGWPTTAAWRGQRQRGGVDRGASDLARARRAGWQADSDHGVSDSSTATGKQAASDETAMARERGGATQRYGTAASGGLLRSRWWSTRPASSKLAGGEQCRRMAGSSMARQGVSDSACGALSIGWMRDFDEIATTRWR